MEWADPHYNKTYRLNGNLRAIQDRVIVEDMNTGETVTKSGIVIMDDGTKYVCSVRHGSVSRIRPGQEAEIIAKGIPSAASMCYDSIQHQLVIPMNPNNGLAFLKL